LRKCVTRAFALVFLFALCTGSSGAQAFISASEAKNHAGKNATVCGEVASTHYAATSRDTPTFINLDKPYPDPVFTIVIWGSDRPKFGHPEDEYRGRQVCVTGTIRMYRGVPEVVAHEPGQISAK
jgi:hypothetical protein